MSWRRGWLLGCGENLSECLPCFCQESGEVLFGWSFPGDSAVAFVRQERPSLVVDLAFADFPGEAPAERVEAAGLKVYVPGEEVGSRDGRVQEGGRWNGIGQSGALLHASGEALQAHQREVLRQEFWTIVAQPAADAGRASVDFRILPVEFAVEGIFQGCFNCFTNITSLSGCSPNGCWECRGGCDRDRLQTKRCAVADPCVRGMPDGNGKNRS